MKKFSKDFTVQVDGVVGLCPAGEAWAEGNITDKKIPVLSCEGPCVRGDIARRAANIVAKEAPFARACYPEAAFVPHSSMARWVKEADRVVMIDGCFLQCIGRVVNNLTDKEKITHIDALSLYHKYTDLFDMDDVPEAERIETARQVADQILATLRQVREPAHLAEEESAPAVAAAGSARASRKEYHGNQSSGHRRFHLDRTLRRGHPAHADQSISHQEPGVL